MMLRRLLSSGAIALVIAWAAPAAATIVTVTFAGNYDRPYFGTQKGAFSGTATYDTASADTTQALQSGALTSFSISSPILLALYGQATVTRAYAGSRGDVTYSPDLDGQGFDRFQLDFSLPSAPTSLFTVDLNFALGSFSPDAYGLPTTLPPLASAVSSNIVLNDTQGDLSIGTLDSFTIRAAASAAPEPAAWAMMVVGFGVLGSALRRPRRSAAAHA